MDKYGDLLNKYQCLLSENERLKAEIENYKKLLGIELSPAAVETEATNGINKYSSSKDKIALFRSLFKGREDVFARRWYSKTTDKSGYQPVCANEWTQGICDKKKYKCSACLNRELLPLSDKDIFDHLSGKDEYGRDVIGIYPMLKDDTCNFLCVDFDEEDFKKDVTAFCQVCRKYSIPANIEISRSGNGAHIWIFFAELVTATTARKLGTGLLTKAMETNSNISFRSYDRLFPNQDTMPEGGFGNLIALPLQGNARKGGNSLFVDEYFVPFEDQWAYLYSIKKLSSETTETLVAELCKNGEYGTLVNDSEEKPWENKKKEILSSIDFCDNIEIIRANMLYVPRKSISNNAQNRIMRMAAFKNPDFFKAQAMRLPIYNKPRIICTADITDEYIALPRGCETALSDLLLEIGVKFTFVDKTNEGSTIPVEFNGLLRVEQQPAVSAMLSDNIGVLSATTAFGKTVVASSLIGELKTNTLVLVHTQSLVTQWKKSLERFLDINIEPPKTKNGKVKKKWSPVGILGAGKNTLNGMIDVAVMQSLVSDDNVKELARNYGMIIVDECHHVSAVNFEKILKYANAKHVYGLTATPTRQDGHHPIIFMQCGPIKYCVDAKEQAEKRPFEHYLMPRFTSYRSIDAHKGITALYKDLTKSELRNLTIIKDVSNAVKQGRTPIILTERREHVLLLAERLSGQCQNIITLFGTTSQKERRQTLEQLEDIPDDESLVIIATGKYVGEGFDYPRLDTLFLALPIAWKGKVAQYAGRLHRNYPGKNEVQVYDYVDIHIPVLEKMYQKRLKGYMSIGYKIKMESTLPSPVNIIYDGKSFYREYCNDILAAKKEILIVSPFMRKGRVTQLIKILTSAVTKDVSVMIITRPPRDFKEKEQKNVIDITTNLEKYGIKVTYRSGFHQKFTVIDNEVVWYGSVNFLSFGIAEESIMRFANQDIAGQLLDTISET